MNILGVNVNCDAVRAGDLRLFAISDAIEKERGISLTELRSAKRDAFLVSARREFALRGRRAGFSFPSLGKFLGKHHTTIFYLTLSKDRRIKV